MDQVGTTAVNEALRLEQARYREGGGGMTASLEWEKTPKFAPGGRRDGARATPSFKEEGHSERWRTGFDSGVRNNLLG